MEFETTSRGFGIAKFIDQFNVECVLKEASIMHEEGCIWLGAKEIGLKHFKAGEGIRNVDLVHTVEEHYDANNRMLLSQTNVRELLPSLRHFADTGSLPSPGKPVEPSTDEKLVALLKEWIPLRRQIIAGETPEMGAVYRRMLAVLEEAAAAEAEAAAASADEDEDFVIE